MSNNNYCVTCEHYVQQYDINNQSENGCNLHPLIVTSMITGEIKLNAYKDCEKLRAHDGECGIEGKNYKLYINNN